MRKIIQCVSNENKNVSPIETINSIKNAGFDGVFLQWYNKTEWQVSQEMQLEHCKSLGLEIKFFHLGYRGINNIWEESEDGDALVPYYINDLDACKKLGINLVVMHLSSKSQAPAPSLVGIKRLQKIVDHAQLLGIKIAFENTKIQGYLEYVFEHIKNSNVGICFDTGHCHCHFDDKFNWEIFKDKIFAVHLHDNDKSYDQHLLPFDGTIDWNDYAQKLNEANYQGDIILESHYDKDYFDISPKEFYKLSYEKAQKLVKLFK